MTARERPSKTAESMRRGFKSVASSNQSPEIIPEPAAEVATTEHTTVAKRQPAWQRKGMTRYTLNLDKESYRVFDGLMFAARRQLGGRVDKSELIRALLLLAADDASLREQVIQQVLSQRD